MRTVANVISKCTYDSSVDEIMQLMEVVESECVPQQEMTQSIVVCM
jgi:hypothetical protein